MARLVRTPIDVAAVTAEVASEAAGATVVFLGTTRRWTAGRETLRLAYEAYEAMALRSLEELETEARRRWPLTGTAIVHRLGVVELTEPSVAVAVSSPHRAAAFEAGRWLIDRLKEDAPIWKQEHWADGSTEWIHPTGAEEPPR